MFQLTEEEAAALKFQFGTSNVRGGRRYIPYAFTEQGGAMLSSVLRSPRAVLVNIEIMRSRRQSNEKHRNRESGAGRVF